MPWAHACKPPPHAFTVSSQNDWVIMAMEMHAKTAVNGLLLQLYYDKPECHSQMIGIITTKINDLMMTYFYVGYGINNVDTHGYKISNTKKTSMRKNVRPEKKTVCS